jgi:hypothetical protein
MDHPPDFRHVLHLILKEIVHGFSIGDIALLNHDVGAENSGVINQLLHFGSHNSGSGNQDNVSSSLIDHPSSHTSSQATCTSDEDIGAIGTKELVALAPWSCLKQLANGHSPKHGQREIRTLTRSPGCGEMTNLLSVTPFFKALNATATSEIE